MGKPLGKPYSYTSYCGTSSQCNSWHVPVGARNANFSHRNSWKIAAFRGKVLSPLPAEPLELTETMGPLQPHVPDAVPLFQGLTPEAGSLASGWAVLRISKHKGRFSFVCVSKAHLLAKRRERGNGNLQSDWHQVVKAVAQIKCYFIINKIKIRIKWIHLKLAKVC